MDTITFSEPSVTPGKVNQQQEAQQQELYALLEDMENSLEELCQLDQDLAR